MQAVVYHGPGKKPATLHREELWTRDVTLATGLVDTYATPTLLRLVAHRRLAPDRLATHHFALDQFMDAYDLIARAGDTGALKVVVRRGADK